MTPGSVTLRRPPQSIQLFGPTGPSGETSKIAAMRASDINTISNEPN
jgi:hypothetical protein